MISRGFISIRLQADLVQQALAADGAIACLSSSFVTFSLNADRAPQLKRISVRRLHNALMLDDKVAGAVNMSIEYFKDLAIGIGALVTAFSLFAAGVIFLWKREWQTRLQLSVGIDSFNKIGRSFLIEPVCVIVNKGLLRCYIYRLDLSVRYLLREDKLEQGSEKILGATLFPHQAVKAQLVKPEWGWTYVEAGIERRLSHVIHIPEEAVAILVWVKLYHKKKVEDDFFTAQQIFVIDSNKLVQSEP